MIFHALDSDGHGYLTQSSIVSLLVTWGVPYAEALHCFDIFDSHSAAGCIGRISFHEFLVDWEPIWRFQLGRVDEAIKQFQLSQEEELEEAEEAQDGIQLRRRSGPSVHGKLSDQSQALAAAHNVAQTGREETARLREELKEARDALASMQQDLRP